MTGHNALPADAALQALRQQGPRGPRLTPNRRALLQRLAILNRKASVHDVLPGGMDPGRAVTLLHEMRKVGLVSLVEASTHDGHHHRGVERVSITDLGLAALARAGATADYLERQRQQQDVAQGAVDTAPDTDAAAPDVSPQPDDDSTARQWEAEYSDFAKRYPRDPFLGGYTGPDIVLPDELPDAYPVLTALRQRQQRLARVQALLAEAADLAGTDDTGLGVRLLEASDAIPAMSAIESEYLRYAAAQPAPDGPQGPDTAGVAPDTAPGAAAR